MIFFFLSTLHTPARQILDLILILFFSSCFPSCFTSTVSTSTTTTNTNKATITWGKTLYIRHNHEIIHSIVTDRGNSFIYLCGSMHGPRIGSTHESHTTETSSPSPSSTTKLTPHFLPTDGIVHKIASDNGKIIWSYRLTSDERQKITSMFTAIIETSNDIIACALIHTPNQQQSYSIEIHKINSLSGKRSISPNVIYLNNINSYIPKRIFILSSEDICICANSNTDSGKIVLFKYSISNLNHVKWTLDLSLSNSNSNNNDCDSISVVTGHHNVEHYSTNDDYYDNYNYNDIIVVAANGIIRSVRIKSGYIIWYSDRLVNGDMKQIMSMEACSAPRTASIFIAWIAYDTQTEMITSTISKLSITRGTVLWHRLITIENDDNSESTFKLRGSLQVNEISNKHVRLLVWPLSSNKLLQAVYISEFNKDYSINSISITPGYETKTTWLNNTSKGIHNDKYTSNTIADCWGAYSTFIYHATTCEEQDKQQQIELSTIEYSKNINAKEIPEILEAVLLSIDILPYNSSICNVDIGQIADITTEILHGHLLDTVAYEDKEKLSFSTKITRTHDEVYRGVPEELEQLFESKEEHQSEIEKILHCENGSIVKIGESLETLMTRSMTLQSNPTKNGGGDRKLVGQSSKGRKKKSKIGGIGTYVGIAIGTVIFIIVIALIKKNYF